MRTNELSSSLARLFAELVNGAPQGGGAFILNSGDAGLLRSLGKLSAADVSQSVHEGATIRHLRRTACQGTWTPRADRSDRLNPSSRTMDVRACRSGAAKT